MDRTVRVRFAPSPTGFLHVGGLRTALYNYLFAKHHGGKFVLRIEDTDQSRRVEGAIENLISTLEWSGVHFDEGPGRDGGYGPYIQSQRLELYQLHAGELIEKGKAYYCFCSPERLEEVRKRQIAAKLSPSYDRHCRDLPKEDAERQRREGEKSVVRMKVPISGEMRFDDLIRGSVTISYEVLDDQVLIKSDGFPTYHLAVVVDDHLMGISHVIRGEEWLPSTPKHILLYQYFGWELPKFAHLPLLLNPDKSKLSKRQGDVAVEDYHSKGYLKEAIVNFIAFLGWNPGDEREIFTLDELIREFSLERVGKAGAVFNVEKLNWLNFEHLRKKPDAEVLAMLKEYLAGSAVDMKHLDDEYLLSVISAMRERVTFVKDFVEKSPYFFQRPEKYDPDVIKKRWNQETPHELKTLLEEFSRLEKPKKEDFEAALHRVAERLRIGHPILIHPLRLAVSGMGAGPGLYDILFILGKEEIIQRTNLAIERIKPMQKNLEDNKTSGEPPVRKNFIRDIVDEDLKTNKFGGRVHTRFPPEPNGYLHIGHAKSICLNFGLARDYNGFCNLRFDDTNPTKEELEYVKSIESDVRWLGFDWEDRLYYASDYFDQLCEYAVQLIKKGKAYVCDLNADEVREHRGTLTKPGQDSPYRNRTVDENLALFERMRKGEFPDGTRTLRAKIDMASPNLNMRDPVMYRILHATHHRTGDKWCIYPMYDWAHGQSDSIERITHSICTLEFEDHRPLYDWFVEQLEIYHPQQIEFARLNLTYTVMSKRKLLELVEDGDVKGWDDPRMPTICGLRRRGYTPESIRTFADRIGVAKSESTVDVALLEDCLRDDLNKRAQRVMAVLRPLKLVIENYPEGLVEELDAVNNPEDPSMGTRKVPFSKVLYIEQDDFRDHPPKKYFRLSPGAEVRLRYAYIIKCVGVIKDEKTGEIVELRCTYDPETRSGSPQSARKVKGTIHWVSAAHAVDAEARVYDRLFSVEDPGGDNWKSLINPNSLQVMKQCKVEPSLASAKLQDRFQFERLGYFCVDDDSREGNLVFNRTVTLRDTWAKIEKSN